jgi:glycosyltransferase involved in cell wall biosynthesis
VSHSRSDDFLTIITPIKNYHPRHLEESLCSVFKQSSPRWQLKLVIEESDVAGIATTLGGALADPRVELLINQGSRLAGAFNTAMRAARSKFVAILLADDRWRLCAVQLLLDCIRASPEADFFHSGLQVIDEHGKAISSVRRPTQQPTLGAFIEGEAVKHLLCWRRDMALAIGGMDESINDVGPDDYDFPWTMFEHGARFRAIDVCLYDYRDHRDCYRLTTHLPRNIHIDRLARILAKHRVPPPVIRQRLRYARVSFLRQCLFRNSFDRWVKHRFWGVDPRRGWRQHYAFAEKSGNRQAAQEQLG